MSRVQFNPYDMGSFVRLPLGSTSILLAIDRLEPTDRGTRVHALIGNPSRLALPDAYLALSYTCRGRWDSECLVCVRFNVGSALPAGSWTRAEVLLPDAAPRELDAIEVTAS